MRQPTRLRHPRRSTRSRSEEEVLQGYLDDLDAELADLPAPQRTEILTDVRAHVADALEEGRPLHRVLTALGPARSYREELGLAPALTTAPATARMTLQVSAAIAASVAAVLAVTLHLLHVLPWQAGTGVPQASGLADDFTFPVSIVLVVLPAVLTVLALAAARPLGVAAQRRWPGAPGAADRVAAASAVVVSASLVLDFWSTGWLYVPSALLLWTAALVPARMRRRPRGGAPLHRRVLRTLVVAAPAVLLLLGQLTSGPQRTPDGSWQLAPAAAVPVLLLVVAALVGLQLRLGHVLLVVVGALAMAVGMAEESPFVAAVWWVGGLWVAVGLVALVDGTPVAGRTWRRSGRTQHADDAIASA